MIFLSALDDLINRCTFEKIEALTQYPKILPYHKIQDNLALNQLDELPNNYQPLPTHPEKLDILIQEKIQGVNCRIIIFHTDFFIGTDEIIYAKGDRISLSPVIAPIINILEQFISMNQGSLERVVVLYGQAFGQGMPHAERYTTSKKRGFRIFDGFSIPAQDVIALCDHHSVNEINSWVNNLQQSFFSVRTLNRFCETFNIPQVPVLFSGTLDQVPTDKAELLKWMLQFSQSKLALDKKPNNNMPIQEQPKKVSIDSFFDDANNNGIPKQEIIKPEKINNILYGKSAGIIVRTLNRSYIRSISFDHYLQPNIIQKPVEEKTISTSSNNIFDTLLEDEMPNLAFKENKEEKPSVQIPSHNIQDNSYQQDLLQQDIQNKDLDIIQVDN